MIWIKEKQNMLCCTDKGSLLLISLSNDQLKIEQEYKVKEESLKIFSLQKSISDENLILLSTNNGIIFVKYSYDKNFKKYTFYPNDSPRKLFKD
jgi:hypothetical protein